MLENLLMQLTLIKLIKYNLPMQVPRSQNSVLREWGQRKEKKTKRYLIKGSNSFTK